MCLHRKSNVGILSHGKTCTAKRCAVKVCGACLSIIGLDVEKNVSIQRGKRAGTLSFDCNLRRAQDNGEGGVLRNLSPYVSCQDSLTNCKHFLQDQLADRRPIRLQFPIMESSSENGDPLQSQKAGARLLRTRGDVW
jgi:hypothetical protein